jgi:hypothetical protein
MRLLSNGNCLSQGSQFGRRSQIYDHLSRHYLARLAIRECHTPVYSDLECWLSHWCSCAPNFLSRVSVCAPVFGFSVAGTARRKT